MRVSKNFWEMTDKFKKVLEEQGVKPCSDPIVTEIIFQKIQNAGGIKELQDK